MENNPYQWTRNDRIRYFISMVPVALMLIGTTIVLLPFSKFMALLWWLIYAVVNIFQAGCCIGCPYRGKYCPAFFGVYIGNWISNFFYKEYEYEKRQFKYNALGGEISLMIFLIFPLYWLYITQWYYVLIYLALVIVHIFIFVPTQCKHCSYSQTCPGGRSFSWVCKWFRK
jgi:MFS family permease